MNPNPSQTPRQPEGHHKLDTAERVFFYEQDFYVLSNFSAFTLQWRGIRFDTSEAAYHYEKFREVAPNVAVDIKNAPSAHGAFKIAEQNKEHRRPDWDAVKVETMRDILRAKVAQHEYVRRKLLATGDRQLIEDSWRDDFWGWGPNRDGKNMLGRLWMEIRDEIRATAQPLPCFETGAEKDEIPATSAPNEPPKSSENGTTAITAGHCSLSLARKFSKPSPISPKPSRSHWWTR